MRIIKSVIVCNTEKSNTVCCGCVRATGRPTFSDDASMAGTCFARKWNGRLSFTQMICAERNSLQIDVLELAKIDKAKWFNTFVR